MFTVGTLSVDPPQPTDYVRREQGDGEDVVEQESFSTSQILQQLVYLFRRCGISNCVRLDCDDRTLFQDDQGQMDDLTTAARTLAGESPDVRKSFEELRLVLEHQGSLLRTVIDVQVTRTHDVDVCPVVVRVAGFLHGLKADGEWDAERQGRLEPVFSSQEAHDVVCAAVREEFDHLMQQLRMAFLQDMHADGVESDWACRIVDGQVATDDWLTCWHQIFDASTLTENDVQYCFRWHPCCEERGIQLSEYQTVDAEGVVLRRFGRRQLAAAEKVTPATEVEFMVNPLAGHEYPRAEWPESFSSFFGSSKREVWRVIADRIGAEFQAGGFFFGEDQVFYHFHNRRICLTTRQSYSSYDGPESERTYTVMTAHNVVPEGFRCSIARSGFLSGLIQSVFGTQDIEIGDLGFDEDFVIKSNDVERARALLSNQRLRDLISLQPQIRLELNGDIQFKVSEVVRDPVLVLRLFELFIDLLIWCRIQSPWF